jgi:hypothetical protein
MVSLNPSKTNLTSGESSKSQGSVKLVQVPVEKVAPLLMPHEEFMQWEQALGIYEMTVKKELC